MKKMKVREEFKGCRPVIELLLRSGFVGLSCFDWRFTEQNTNCLHTKSNSLMEKGKFNVRSRKQHLPTCGGLYIVLNVLISL